MATFLLRARVGEEHGEAAAVGIHAKRLGEVVARAPQSTGGIA